MILKRLMRTRGLKFNDNKVMLDLVKGAEIINETTYVVVGQVSEASGNATEVSR